MMGRALSDEPFCVSCRAVVCAPPPLGPLTGPRLDYPTGGTVCFFTGRNFTGESFCASTGTVIRDLLLRGHDNAFASVTVGGASVTACRDRDFSSYCERIVEDQAALHGFLSRNVSSNTTPSIVSWLHPWPNRKFPLLITVSRAFPFSSTSRSIGPA